MSNISFPITRKRSATSPLEGGEAKRPCHYVPLKLEIPFVALSRQTIDAILSKMNVFSMANTRNACKGTQYLSGTIRGQHNFLNVDLRIQYDEKDKEFLVSFNGTRLPYDWRYDIFSDAHKQDYKIFKFNEIKIIGSGYLCNKSPEVKESLEKTFSSLFKGLHLHCKLLILTNMPFDERISNQIAADCLQVNANNGFLTFDDYHTHPSFKKFKEIKFNSGQIASVGLYEKVKEMSKLMLKGDGYHSLEYFRPIFEALKQEKTSANRLNSLVLHGGSRLSLHLHYTNINELKTSGLIPLYIGNTFSCFHDKTYFFKSRDGFVAVMKGYDNTVLEFYQEMSEIFIFAIERLPRLNHIPIDFSGYFERFLEAENEKKTELIGEIGHFWRKYC